MKVGHNAKPRKIPARIRMDVTGQTFGNWTVLGFWERKRNTMYWLCVCECGSKHAVTLTNLRSGKSTQCLDCSRVILSDHRRSRSPGYTIWLRVRDNLCKEWRDDCGRFLDECFSQRDGRCLVAIDDRSSLSDKRGSVKGRWIVRFSSSGTLLVLLVTLMTGTARLCADLIPPGNKGVSHKLVFVDSPLLKSHRLIATPVRGFGGHEEVQPDRPFHFSTKYGTRLYVVPSDFVPPTKVNPGEPLPFPSCDVPVSSTTYVPIFSPIASLRSISNSLTSIWEVCIEAANFGGDHVF